MKTATALESRKLDDLRLKEFLENNLNRGAYLLAPPFLGFSHAYPGGAVLSPRLDVARARWQVAEASIITAAGQRPNPIARFTPEYVTHPWPLSCSGK
ncbi:MAG: hypothetical protein HY790_09590 [Deltaproteobacteria bacterium]|nr:hypothetical protein [Deltaproteobacteria bacterium]